MNFNLTFIGQMIAFAIFIYATMRFIWPPIVEAMEKRQKDIADGLNAAERAQKDLQLAQDKVKEQLKDAKVQAAEIIEQAKKRATQIVDEETQRGHAEREKIIAQGQLEVDAQRNRAKEELRTQVAALAVAGAERILTREIDAQAHSDIVEKLVTEL